MELVIGIVLGGLVSWGIAHWYYRQSSKQAPEWAANTPEWAKPLIAKLPDAPVSSERLVQLYHEALELGDLQPDPYSGYVACPKCGAPSSEFKGWEDIDPVRGDLYRGVRCGKCGYDIAGGEV